MPNGEISKEQKGATLVEYVILISLASLVSILALFAVSSGLRKTLCSIVNVAQIGGSAGRFHWDPSLNSGRGMCVEAGAMGDNPRF